MNSYFLLVDCKCLCLPNYTGTLCADLTCQQEDPKCSLFTRESCSSTSPIRNACPFLCNLCPNPSSPSPSPSPSPMPIPTACPAKTCLNGGTFSQNTCSCLCKIIDIFSPIHPHSKFGKGISRVDRQFYYTLINTE
jgi:hypothetical protein